jgi:hypothetical protein
VGTEEIDGALGRAYRFVEHGNEVMGDGVSTGIGGESIPIVAGIGEGHYLARGGLGQEEILGWFKIRGASLQSFAGF